MGIYRPRVGRRLAALAFTLCLAGIAGAQSIQFGGDKDARGDDEWRIQEVFTSHLPDTIAHTALRASLHPRLGDLVDRDYLRVFAGLRYGVTERLELSAGADFYFSHGGGDIDFFEESGIARVQFGAKLNVGRMLINTWHSSIGFDAIVPTGDPPQDFTDGLKHFMPFVTLSRRLDSRPDIRVFWGAGLDLVEPTTYPGVLATNQLDDDSIRFSAGLVWDRGMFHYLFETQYATTRVFGDTDEDVLIIRPGVIWEVPKLRDRTRKSGWMIGVAGKASFGPDGSDYGASAKLRYNFDLKRLFTRGGSASK